MVLQGAQWMKQVVSFDKLKLTNNQLDDNGHVSSSLIFVSIAILFQRPLPGDSELDAQVPAATARDLHQPPGGGRRRHRELPHFHFPGDQVHRSHHLPEPPGEGGFCDWHRDFKDGFCELFILIQG